MSNCRLATKMKMIFLKLLFWEVLDRLSCSWTRRGRNPLKICCLVRRQYAFCSVRYLFLATVPHMVVKTNFWSDWDRKVNNEALDPVSMSTPQLSTPQLITPLHCTENPIYVFPEMKLHGLVPNFLHLCICELFIYSPGSICLFGNWETEHNVLFWK